MVELVILFCMIKFSKHFLGHHFVIFDIGKVSGSTTTSSASLCLWQEMGGFYPTTVFSDHDCFCTDDGETTYSYGNPETSAVCYHYTLASTTDCGQMLTLYLSLLTASYILCAILAVTALVFSILACVSVCCGKKPSSESTPAVYVAAPRQEMVATPQQQQYQAR